MARYTNIRVKSNRKPDGIRGDRYYTSPKYPQIPLSINDTYVYAEQGDRYDQLALQYYGDSSLWWIISRANPNQPFNSLYPNVGSQIVIPDSSNTISIVATYELMNGI